MTGDSQHQFTKSKLCLINLIACHDKTGGVVDEQRTVDVTYLDSNKAFDTVSDNIMIDKLMKDGIDKGTVQWTENQLNCQAQKLVISGKVQLEVSHQWCAPGH